MTAPQPGLRWPASQVTVLSPGGIPSNMSTLAREHSEAEISGSRKAGRLTGSPVLQ